MKEKIFDNFRTLGLTDLQVQKLRWASKYLGKAQAVIIREGIDKHLKGIYEESREEMNKGYGRHG